jgi:hypothetical protein
MNAHEDIDPIDDAPADIDPTRSLLLSLHSKLEAIFRGGGSLSSDPWV